MALYVSPWLRHESPSPTRQSTRSARTELALRADRCGALLTLFPELGVSGYSIEDLVQQDALLDEVEYAIVDVLAGTR